MVSRLVLLPVVPDVPLPVVPEVPEVPLVPLAGGVAFWSLGVVGVVAPEPVPGVGDAAGGVVLGVVDGVVALSVVPVLVPVSAERFLQPASVAVARIALNSSVVLNVFMVFPFAFR